MLLLSDNSSFAQTADFTASPVSGCAPLIVDFTDASTGTINLYTWNFGNSNGSAFQNPSTTYNSPGTYTVTLTVTGPGGSNTATKIGYIIVYDQPAVSFTATSPVAGCTPHNVQFSSTVTANSPGTVTYSWDFGDGYTGTGANPSHTYTYPGTYPVTLTVTNGAGCVRTVSRTSYITAHTVPVGGFNATQTAFCSIPAAASFTNTTVGGTTPYTTTWTFGDGGTGSGNTPTHNYITGGGFTVTMTVTDANGCVTTVAAPAYISVNATNPTFTGPTSVCVAADALFTNTTTGATSTAWDFDDGTTGTGASVTHVYQSAGTYTVEMTTYILGCTKTITKTITVDPKPVPAIAISPAIPCPAPVTLTFTGSSTVVPGTSYTWTWKSTGTTSVTGQTVTKTYTTNIMDEVKVVVTSASGCKDSIVRDDIMIRNILVNITPGGFCDTEPYGVCEGHQIGFGVDLLSSLPPPEAPCAYGAYPLPAITWLWDFGDGSPTSNLPAPFHTYPTSGDYVVTCIITTANGCTATGTRDVHVDVPVTPSFTGTPLVVCPKQQVILTNTTVTPLPNTLYTWLVFDNIAGIDDTVIGKNNTTSVGPLIKLPGTYTVKLLTNHRGCIDSFVRYDYIIVHPPGAKFSSFVRCSPSRIVDFTNQSSASTSQLWDFGDGNTSPLFSPSHTYAATGTYKVKLTAYNSTFGCLDRDSAFVTVFDPNLDFTATDRTVCTNDYSRFAAIFGGSGAVNYSWIFGTYQTPYVDSNTMDFRFTTKGYHDVVLITKSGNNCYDTIRKQNFVLVSRPEVSFSANPPIGCSPLQVLFTDNSVNTPIVPTISRAWTFGDGGTASNNVATVNHTYTVPGNYTVKLIVEDAQNCIDSLIQSNFVSVHKPRALYTASDDSVCVNGPVLFVSTSFAATVPLRHDWDFGDGRPDTGRTPIHRFTSKGKYAVRLVVTDAVGCTDTLILPDSIYVDGPTAAFTMSDSLGFCPSLPVIFTNHSSLPSTYLWDFGTGSPVIVTDPTFTFNGPGVYPVSLVATDVNGCTDTARDTVRILGYNGAFTYTPLTGCAPMTVTFSTLLTGIPQIRWDFADGNIVSGSTSITHTYLTPGPYLPKVIFSDGAACSSTSLGLDTIRVDKLNADFSWSIPCMGVPFSLTDKSTAMYTPPNAQAWYFGGGDTAAGSPVSYNFLTPGNHPVTLVAGSATGCRDTITKDVFINPLPVINVTNDTGVCPNDKVRLFVTGGLNYTWSPAPDSMQDCPVCDIAFVHLDSAAGGTYKVFFVTGVDGNNCVNKDSVRVTIKFRTDYTTGLGGEICVGDTFRLHAEGAEKYEWLPAATIDSPFIASPLATPERTTTYIVAAREGSCDIDTQMVTVVVHSLPLFSAGNDEVISLGSAVTLKPTRGGITRIEWAADTTLSCLDCFDPTAHPFYTRTYHATAYNEFGCRATDSVTVHVRCNGSLVFIPNTFTPNGDGLNDYFFPRGDGIERMSIFRVYNRWGELVFEKGNATLNDERGGWDGTYKGKALPPDVYVYTMQSICSSGEILKWKGDVTLMK